MNEVHELAVERVMDAPVAAVWRAFTRRLADWWCPPPWTTEVVEIDWRVGGRFAMVMRGPDGEEAPGDGVLLAVEPERLAVFTNTLGPGWTPLVPQPFAMVGRFAFSDLGNGRTGYRASARHATDATMEQHRAIGFEPGWSAVAVQLEAVAREVAQG